MATGWSVRFSVAVAACAIGLVTLAHAADDTARFYGTWETSFPFNGQTVTMVSVHDDKGYKNYLRTPNGLTPAGDGGFSAANGRYRAVAPKPNDSGTYHFVDDNTVVCANAAGETVTWRRQQAPPAAAVKSTPAPAAVKFAPPAAALVATSQNAATNRAIAAFDRKDYNTAWREFMDGANQGDAEAQAGVGAMLFRHLNPPGTGYYAQCEQWLQASANQGSAKGMSFLAQFYYADGVAIAGGINPGINNAPIPPALQAQAERRFALARQWSERSAAKGDGYAMGNLAILLDAESVARATPRAPRNFRAQVAGHADADFANRDI